MNDHKKIMRSLLFPFMAIAALASLWQFYFFVWFRNGEGVFDPQGGTFHLVLAFGSAILACALAASLFFTAINRAKDNVIRINSQRGKALPCGLPLFPLEA